MAEPNNALAQYSVEAIRASAEPLGIPPLVLAKRLQGGEVFRLLRLLHAALPEVSSPELRHRIEDLLPSITDGRMPLSEQPGTSFDRALATLRERREPGARNDADDD